MKKAVLPLILAVLLAGSFALVGCSGASGEDSTPATATADAQAGYAFVQANCQTCHSMPTRANFSGRDQEEIVTLLTNHDLMTFSNQDALDVAAWVLE